MNRLDYLVLLGTLVGIAAYGVWRTRGRRDLSTYLRGSSDTRWLTIGLSVMATQASAITFLSMPGQGYEDGLSFVQNYFGLPLALIVVSLVFVPIYRRLNVYTAYEYLGRRFDARTRLLGAGLFLLQRGLGAGITIYAPAIVLSSVLGWRLDITIIGTGLLAIVYTVTGGNDAVNLTQRYQLGIIFAGMLTAVCVLFAKLPPWLTVSDTLSLAGSFHKINAVDFSLDPQRRYTFWSGLLGGGFLSLAYFGTDQSQVGRYLSGGSIRESRLGLMFNAVCKIPMQFLILFLGVLIFIFYQFETPPVFFNEPAWKYQSAQGAQAGRFRTVGQAFAAGHESRRSAIEEWFQAKRGGDTARALAARAAVTRFDAEVGQVRADARALMRAADPKTANDTDYVFITFILHYLPHGVIGLLVAAFFAAALSSKAGELNALGSTTTVDFYRHVVRPDADDAHYVRASKWFTAMWGFVAIVFALLAQLAENLIQAVNILGSIFYGVVLGLFCVAFFWRRVGGTEVFWGAVIAQTLIFVFYFGHLPISYLWYNPIGCVLCVGFSLRHPSRDVPASSSPRMSAPCICFGQQPCGFFPRRFLYAKIMGARRLQRELGGEIVFFYHDSDHDPRETQTILTHHQSGKRNPLNFAFANKVQRKWSPLFLKRVPADWQANTARQLPAYVPSALADTFRQVQAANVADFCLDMYTRMGLLDGIRVVRSGDPAVRQAACPVNDFFADLPHEGEIVRARVQDGGPPRLHEGGNSYLTLPLAAPVLPAQISPTRDTRLRWMQSVVRCTHYVSGAGEQAYLNTAETPEITFVHRDPIERSDEAFIGSPE